MRLAPFLLSISALSAQQLTSRAGPELMEGESPQLAVSGLAAGQRATVHSYRRARFYKPGEQNGQIVLAHGFAEFVAGPDGRIDVDRTAPVRGTYQGADPLGLFWSGEKLEAAMPELPPRSVLFRLEVDGATAPPVIVKMTTGEDKLEIQTVNEGRVNGVLARPKGATGPLRAIMLLHGSEGGSTDGARANAIRFARLGYAALGLNYFAYFGDNKLPRGLMNIPVETLAAAREWLATQKDINTATVAVWGVSKGAELALLAATEFPWIDRVVACVPSSVVWAGFGRATAENEIPSSWTIKSRTLPFIAYDRYEDSLEGRISSGAVHQRSLLKATPENRLAARIPIEKAAAQILLFGATKDHVWPSADMIGEISRSLKAAGKGNQLASFVYPNASHFICGLGSEAVRINPVRNPEGNDPSPEADAKASAATWAETKRFLQ